MVRVIAHFMHEYEEAAAFQRLKDGAIRTDSYIYGEIDDADIADLKAQGLVVQILDDDPPIDTPGFDPQPRAGMLMHSGYLDQPVHRARAVSDSIDTSGPNYYLIDLNGPLLPEWGDELSNLDVQVIEHVPDSAYTARLTPDQASAVGDLPFVRTVTVYTPDDTAPPEPRRRPARADLDVAPREMVTYDVLLHRAEDMDEFTLWLEDQTVDIAGSSGRKARIYLIEDSGLYGEIRIRPEVLSIYPYTPPKLHNDLARQILGIDSNPGQGLNQTGADQIVAVADTGLDEQHPDFQGRIEGIVARGRPSASDDPHGHGTHVSGSVLGDGSASRGAIKGAAPGARLFFQALMDQEGELQLPLNLAELFQEAYDAGARIHNNSWGAETASKYNSNSLEVDEFVHDNPEMLLVFSAGNAGQAADRLNSKVGFTDWLSIGSPASAKNVLTVGASRSSRDAGAYAQNTFREVWPNDFPNPPIGDELVSGNPEGLAAFSSRGPCDDHRIKPDLVAPGTNILSAKSSLAPARKFWGSHSNSHYAYMGGTSMSAPLVAGCAALVREYYEKDRSGHKASAALLKATLINGTRWLNALDATAAPPGVPNFHQGFGCLFMPWCIPNPASPSLILEFIDSWEDTRLQFTQSGQRLRRQVSVAGGERLRICMAYTDRPARATQNNLNLFVQHLGSGEKWMGNADLPLGLNIPDPDNNVEVVRVEDPTPGDYLIQIAATNVFPGSSQAFALVVTGELSSKLVRV